MSRTHEPAPASTTEAANADQQSQERTPSSADATLRRIVDAVETPADLVTRLRDEPAQAAAVLATLEEGGRLASLVARLGADGWAALAGAVDALAAGADVGPPPGASLSRALRTVAFAPGAALAVALACFRARFRLTKVGGSWDLPGLRRAWSVLDALPEAHVGGNDRFDRLLAGQGKSASGVYYGASQKFSPGDRIGFTYNPQDLEEKVGERISAIGDPLTGTSAFDVTLRHEIGHALDEAHKFSAAYCPTPPGGTWREHASAADAMAELVDQVGLPAMLTAEQLATLRTWLDPYEIQYKDRTVEQLPFWSTVDARAREALATCVRAIRQGYGMTYLQDDCEAFGRDRRVLVLGYGGKWTSYAYEARSRKVSNFQFKAPIEWFAEAYAAYYAPDPRGPGALLAARDPDTASYFERVVDRTIATRS